MGNPGPQIHYHFKTRCSNQTTGKRIYANLVFMSPWLKHLQSCDTNRLSRAEMKLGTYVSVLRVAALLCMNAWVCSQLSVGVYMCVWSSVCVCICALKWVRRIGAEQSPSCDVRYQGSWLCVDRMTTWL